MYKYFTIKIAVILQIVVNSTADNRTREIEDLEKEKGELYKRINLAIDESVSLLKSGNDSEALLGVEYLQRLKDQLREINGTDAKDLEATNDTRRAKNLKLDLLEVANVFQKNKKDKKAKKQNKVVIKKKIEEWLMQRELERQKIRQYKQRLRQNVQQENCPRHGLGAKKSRAVSGKRRNRKSPKYPCCRKCCKKSYMGCL